MQINLYSSPNIIMVMVIESRKMRQVGHVSHTHG